jgi:hypothetical protein
MDDAEGRRRLAMTTIGALVRRRRWMAIAFGCALALAGCGGDSASARPFGDGNGDGDGDSIARVTASGERAAAARARADLGGQRPDPAEPLLPYLLAAIDPTTGNIWVANSFASEYWIFKPDGTFVEAWGSPAAETASSTSSPIDPHRKQLGQSPSRPTARSTSPTTATAASRVLRRPLVPVPMGGFGGRRQVREPFGIATDDQTVYVADDDRGDIQAFDMNGRFLERSAAAPSSR